MNDPTGHSIARIAGDSTDLQTTKLPRAHRSPSRPRVGRLRPANLDRISPASCWILSLPWSHGIMLGIVSCNPLPSPAPNLADGFARILAALAKLIAAGCRRAPRLALLAVPLCNRLSRTVLRFKRLMAHLKAGHLPRRHRSCRSGSRPSGPALPTSRAWLTGELGSEAACYVSQLQALLEQPAAVKLLSVAPSVRSAPSPPPHLRRHHHPARTSHTAPASRGTCC